MSENNLKNIRNILFLGHSGCGKTTVAEALLVNAGAISKMGSVEEGTTASDYNEDEKERKCSTSSSLIAFSCGAIRINIIDTPGYLDFVGEIVGGLRATDSAVIVVNATSGIEIGTERAWKMCKEANVPVAIFVNMMDKEHADFTKCVESIKKKFGKRCIIACYPIGEGLSFKGVANLLTGEGMDKLSEEEKPKASRLTESLNEGVAETDDALLEKYLEKGEVSQDELKAAYKKGIAKGKVVPVVAGSSMSSNLGVKELLDTIVNFLPSPSEVAFVEAVKLDTNENTIIEPRQDAPFTGLVVKTLQDTYLGQISIFRTFSGKISSNSSFYNVSKSSKEKIGQLFSLVGNSQKLMESASAGDIACAAKLKDTQTGDSIGEEKSAVKFKDIVFPNPAISFSIKPKSRADEDRISNALHKLTAEDPTFKASRDVQTRELIVSGMGDIQINIMINRMKLRYGVNVDLGTPKVAYKETVTAKGDTQYRHKKQTGGAGQFAEVWMRIEPLTRGEGFQFVDEVVGGAIPAPFIVSCEKGIKAAMQSGVLAGFPVVDMKAVVYDGKTHPVDSKDIAFQIAARHAFKDASLKAKPVILEPIMNVEIIVPDEFMGDITGSLNSRRGRILGMEPGDDVQTIKATVPLEEMYKYVNELKSITGGRGTYNMSFSHYEILPSNLAQNIIAKAKEAKQAEHEK